MNQDAGEFTVERAYSGESDGLIVIRTHYGSAQAVIFFKANLPSGWEEEERLSSLDQVHPLIEAAAARDFAAGRFIQLRMLSENLEDAILIILGWGDLAPSKRWNALR